MLSCLLEFDCMNNVAKYEARIQGLRKSLNLQIKCIEVFDESQVAIKRVRYAIYYTYHHLNNYKWEVWDLMHKFESFNIRFIPHLMKSKEGMLANAASNVSPSDDFTSDKLYVELIYRPSILNNITNCSIFDDDEQIINFLHSEDTFKGSIIDDEQHETLLQAFASKDNPKYNNIMPKKIIKLERLLNFKISSKDKPTQIQGSCH